MAASPMKQPIFTSDNKENAVPTSDIFDDKTPITTIVAAPKSVDAKSLEADEPILKENKNRFVLFPLK